MSAKEYLSEIQKMKRRVDVLQRRMAELRTQVEGIKAITYDTDRVQASAENRLEINMLKLVDCEHRYITAVANLHSSIQIRERQIGKLDNPVFVELLCMRYIDGFSLKRIAEELHQSHPDKNYGEDYIRHLHGWALQAFEKKYPEKCKNITQGHI